MHVIGLTLSMLCGSILRIDVHETWSETVVATFRRPNCVQTLSRNKQQSTLDGYYTFIRIFIHILIHIHIHIHSYTYIYTYIYTYTCRLKYH
jgi:hypothetical protein